MASVQKNKIKELKEEDLHHFARQYNVEIDGRERNFIEEDLTKAMAEGTRAKKDDSKKVQIESVHDDGPQLPTDGKAKKDDVLQPSKRVKGEMIAGLPFQLAKNKRDLVHYVTGHGFEWDKHIKKMNITTKERDGWQTLCRFRKKRDVPLGYYAAALRLWATGKYPLVAPPKPTLDSLVLAGGN